MIIRVLGSYHITGHIWSSSLVLVRWEMVILVGCRRGGRRVLPLNDPLIVVRKIRAARIFHGKLVRDLRSVEAPRHRTKRRRSVMMSGPSGMTRRHENFVMKRKHNANLSIDITLE